jgi:hypothetical protein
MARTKATAKKDKLKRSQKGSKRTAKKKVKQLHAKETAGSAEEESSESEGMLS